MEPNISMHAVSVTASVRQALRALNDLSGETMTLFALDGDGVLCGTVTDGDIRRALISGASLDDTVCRVMHRDFRALRPGDDAFTILPRLRGQGIILVPVLDAEGRIQDLIDLRTARTRLPIDAVLMAGGRGERLRPLTLEIPKPLLEIGGKPIIDYNIEELAACGVDNIFVTVNYLREQIERHFSVPVAGVRVRCVAEPARLGTIGSLALIEGFTHDDVLVMNSDLLTTLDFEKMFAHHRRTGALLTVAAVPYTVSVPYAIMQTEGERITGLAEKPTFNYFANAGVYMMRRECITRITPGLPLDAPDFIEALIADGAEVAYFPVEGTWIDIGSPDDFRYANELMSRRARLLQG